MLFNLHKGQMRMGVDGKTRYLKKSPKGTIMMSSLKGTYSGVYHADRLGNIDVKVPKHIDCMVGLGYPIYNGDGKTYPVAMADLLWVNADLNSEYWRRIEQGKNQRINVGGN